jgi:hypothetical protein
VSQVEGLGFARAVLHPAFRRQGEFQGESRNRRDPELLLRETARTAKLRLETLAANS